MPKTPAGRILYALVLLTGFLLLGRSLYHKHQLTSGTPQTRQAPEVVFSQAITANDPLPVETMLREGVRLDALHYKSDKPALQQAAHAGRTAIVNVLLAHGANPQEQFGYYNATALGETMYNKNIVAIQGYANPSKPEEYRAIIAALRARGARLSLYEAVERNDWPALLAAYRAGDPVNGNKRSASSLECVARKGNVVMTKWLLEHGAQINAHSVGSTPLIGAVSGSFNAERRKIAMLLLAHGADVNVTGAFGVTPLMGAIVDNSGKTARLLLEHGAKIEQKSEDMTGKIVGGPTYIATANSNASCGISDLEVVSGGTALIQAARNGNRAMVQILLERGAKINVVDSNGLSPLMNSLYGNHPQITALLLAHSASLNTLRVINDTPLLAAAVHAPETIPMLLKHGADVNESARDGDTALIRAARYGRAETIETLLHNPNTSNAIGWTALHWAVGILPKAVPILLKAGANVNTSNNVGETPLYRAAYTDRIETVRALLAAHADPNIATTQGNTPLRMARRRRQQAIVDMLLQAGAHE